MLSAILSMLQCHFGYLGEILQSLTEMQMNGNQNVSEVREGIYKAYANVTVIGKQMEIFPCNQSTNITMLADRDRCLPYSNVSVYLSVSPPIYCMHYLFYGYSI